MRDILEKSNLNLLGEINKLEQLLKNLDTNDYNKLYVDWIKRILKSLKEKIDKNLKYLSYNKHEIISEVLSMTQENTRLYQLINVHFFGPLYRTKSIDSLCLKFLYWLHNSHDQTKNIPVGITNDEFGVLPNPEYPIIYNLPVSSQLGLLYLPLFFHEYGHLLYACYKVEMDDLVKELQSKIGNKLTSNINRNDEYSKKKSEETQKIVETWYEWCQELFCDIIGLAIGGPCYLYSLSYYLIMRGKNVFIRPFEELVNSSHPVNWLRIKILVEESRNYNLQNEADLIQNEWNVIANGLNIIEDYYGFYDEQYKDDIIKVIDDMLIEASPILYKYHIKSQNKDNSESSSPLDLLNNAWNIFLKSPSDYLDWEETAINQFLNN